MSAPVLPTASNLERALACRASLRLPATYVESPAAARGTALHAFLEAISGGMAEKEALALVPAQWREDAEALPLESLPLGALYQTEVTLAWDWESGKARILGHNLERDYSTARPTEFVGTVDVMARLPGGKVWLADYKSSRNGKTAAARNAQLGMLAVAAAAALEADSAEVVLVFLDGTAPDGAVLDAIDLSIWTEELRGLALYLESDAQDAPRMGAWCRYCPALASCPAQRQQIAVLERGVSMAEALTPEIVAEAWRRLEAVKGHLGQIEAACLAFAAQTPVSLGDGRELRETTTRRESIDGAKAWDVLVAYAGQDVAEQAVELSTSKAAIAKALKAHAPKGKAASMEREVLGLLRDAGAVSVTESVRVSAVKAAAPALGE